MADDVLADIIGRQRDRSIAAILGVKEREADPHLPPAVRAKLRKVVLDQLNAYTGLVMDVLESLSAGQEDGSAIVLNTLWLDKLDEIHAAVVPNGAD